MVYGALARFKSCAYGSMGERPFLFNAIRAIFGELFGIYISTSDGA